jgi:phosphoglycerol transferase MdoB-like AlkP superfamily enzyme
MFLTRAVLIAQSVSLNQIDGDAFDILKILFLGEISDLSALLYILTPISFIYLLPKTLINNKFAKFFGMTFAFIYIYVLLFNLVAEWFFWEEFGVRYNFIAVDYLVYRREVTGNIYESYPLIKILLVIALLMPVFYFLIERIVKKVNCEKFGKFFILKMSLLFLVCLVFSYSFNPKNMINKEFDNNNYAINLSYNGLDGLFSAFNNNTLSYKAFYINYDKDKVLKNLREKISTKNSEYISDTLTDISRKITPINSKGKKYNIALIVVESLSAEFFEYFGNKQNITPFMDELISNSLFFDNFYATGTRTVRGLEAISLSLPPLPGNSILRRPNNENLFSIGSVFKSLGYENKFIYGGYGYFDNMNYFFVNNNFEIVDRANFAKQEINFSNIWGVSDGDLFNKFISEADKSYGNNNPFFSLVLTTSNHRPYTYPEGKIDIPSGTGREGAVKYTDFAIKQLIDDAKKKPWFDNTIFVIVADHCAGSAGKTHIPLNKYHIPLIMYAPKILKPKIVNNLSSQIDIAPTLLGMLGEPYNSKFLGRDIINSPANRAFVSTYQKVGLYYDDKFTILGPKKMHWSYSVDKNLEQKFMKFDQKHLFDTVTFYQSTSYLLSNGYLRDF